MSFNIFNCDIIFDINKLEKAGLMAYSNTIVIVSDNEETFENIKSKFSLLRGHDKVLSTSKVNCIEFLKTTVPNVVIFPHEDEQATFKLIRNIKREKFINQIPVIVLGSTKNRDFFTEAYDAGADEILFEDTAEYELLIRVIWAIKRGIKNNKDKNFDNFLRHVGILDDSSFICEEYGEKFLQSEINYSIAYDVKSSLMLISPNKKTAHFTQELRKVVRNIDIVVPNDDNFYIFMPDTTTKGGKKLFERLSSTFRLNGGLKGVIVEVGSSNFDEIKSALNKNLNSLKENILISLSAKTLEVKVEDEFEDILPENKLQKLKYKRKIKALKSELEEAEKLEAEEKAEKIKAKEKVEEKTPKTEEQTQTKPEEKTLETEKKPEIKTEEKPQKEKIKKQAEEKPLKKKLKKEAKSEEAQKAPENIVLEEMVQENKAKKQEKTVQEVIYDKPIEEILTPEQLNQKRTSKLKKLKTVAKQKNNDGLYEQTFKKKIEIIIVPQFVKYRDIILANIKKSVADIAISEEKCSFMAALDDYEHKITIAKSENMNIAINIEIDNGKKKKVKKTTLNILELDFEKMTKLMTIFLGEFRKNIKNA